MKLLKKIDKEPYKPTWGRTRASICHWNLSFRFHTKEQCQKFIELLMKEDIGYHFEYFEESGDSSTPSNYWVEIHDMSWAKNLTDVAKLLEQVDYEME